MSEMPHSKKGDDVGVRSWNVDTLLTAGVAPGRYGSQSADTEGVVST